MKKENANNENGESSVIRLLDRIATGGAETIIGGAETIIDTTASVPKLASGVVSGITSHLPLPEVLPDKEKIDRSVETLTYAMYALGTFSVIGSIYFSLKTVREFGQWRQWSRYRKLYKSKSKKV